MSDVRLRWLKNAIGEMVLQYKSDDYWLDVPVVLAADPVGRDEDNIMMWPLPEDGGL